jgi:16S rRNA (cytosine967-C5)-methyltransferase
MAISPARTAAFDILLQVEQKDAYASELLHSPKYANLLPADHGLATELVMGVLRWRSLLDGRIATQSSQALEKLDREVLTALRLGAYQILFLDRMPQRAAVHESVELVKRARKRSAVPFANAVLRKLAGTEAQGGRRADFATEIVSASTATRLSESSAHPRWLVERWIHEYGLDAARGTCTYDQRAPDTAIRLGDITEQELRHEGIEVFPGRLLASARVVRSGNVTRTAAYRNGRVVIQDEASQLVALMVGTGPNILDCCAAPGGKTRVLAERNPDASIVAVDLHPHRSRLLRTLVPHKNVEVVTADVRDFPVTGLFDRVLADVPCSGTGTLARNPEIKWRLQPEDLQDLQNRQLEILQSAMKQVAPGGRLVYSTCSLERDENAEVVGRALATNSSFQTIDCRAELQRLQSEAEFIWKDLDSLLNGPYLRTLPGTHPCDGFFAAILQKN